jgi:hypothetical protein
MVYAMGLFSCPVCSCFVLASKMRLRSLLLMTVRNGPRTGVEVSGGEILPAMWLMAFLEHLWPF